MKSYTNYFELKKISENTYQLKLLNNWNKQTLSSTIKDLEKLNFSKNSKLTVDFIDLKECDSSAIIYLISFFKGFEEAKELFGGELPEISYKTQERTLALIDEKINSLKENQ